jgi:hypothetical protein
MSPDDVRTLAAAAGVSFAPERLATVAETWDAFIAPDLERLMATELSTPPAQIVALPASRIGFAG